MTHAVVPGRAFRIHSRVMRSAYIGGFALLVAATLALTSCDDEGPLQGARAPCSYAGGAGLDCDSMPIETAEDGCWKLVGCGVIPLDEPDEDRNWVLDWNQCMQELGRMSPFQETLALECLNVSTCDQLKNESSPIQPSHGDQSLPLCLQYGDQ